MNTKIVDRSTMANGGLWLFVSKIVQVAMSFTVLSILARYLLPADFGLVTLAMVVIGFSQVFGDIGLNKAIVQFEEVNREEVFTAWFLTLLISIFLIVIVVSSSNLVAGYYSSPELEPIINCLSVTFLIRGAAATSESLLFRRFEYRYLSLVSILSYFLGYMVVGVGSSVLGYGVYALVYAALVEAAVKAIGFIIKAPVPFSSTLSFSGGGRLSRFGIGFTMGKLANFLALQADNLIVGKIIGAQGLGMYGRAYQFIMLPANVIGSVIDSLLFPYLSRMQSDKSRLLMITIRLNSILMMLVFPISVVLFLNAELVVAVVLGSGWERVVCPLKVFSLVLVFRTGYKIFGTCSRAMGHVYRNAWRQGLYAVLIVCGSVVGALNGGILGASIGVSAAIVVNYFVMLSHSVLTLGLSLREWGRVFAKNLMLSFFLLLVLYFTALVVANAVESLALQLLLNLFVSVLVYLVVLKICSRWFTAELAHIRDVVESSFGERYCGIFRFLN